LLESKTRFGNKDKPLFLRGIPLADISVKTEYKYLQLFLSFFAVLIGLYCAVKVNDGDERFKEQNKRIASY